MSRVSLASQLPIAMVNGRPYRLLETAATLAAARPNPHRDSSAASASASTYSLPPNVTLATICGEKTELVAHLETCPNYGAIVGKTRATQKALESQYEVELTVHNESLVTHTHTHTQHSPTQHNTLDSAKWRKRTSQDYWGQ